MFVFKYVSGFICSLSMNDVLVHSLSMYDECATGIGVVFVFVFVFACLSGLFSVVDVVYCVVGQS